MVISFDLWGVLLKGSPEFIKKRNELTENFLLTSLEPALTRDQLLTVKDFISYESDYVDKVYKKTREYVDSITNSTSIYINIETIFAMLIDNLIKGLPIPHTNVLYFPKPSLNFLAREYDKTWQQYPPIFREEDKAILAELVDLGHELGISSNISFISSNTIFNYLREINVFDYFEDYNFSDTLYISKPDKSGFCKNSKIHVSMNPLDKWCQQITGCEFFHINKNQTLKDLLKYVIEIG